MQTFSFPSLIAVNSYKRLPKLKPPWKDLGKVMMKFPGSWKRELHEQSQVKKNATGKIRTTKNPLFTQ